MSITDLMIGIKQGWIASGTNTINGVESPAGNADTVDGWNFYSSLSELGLTEATATAESIVNAMPNKSILVHGLSGTATSATLTFPYNYSLFRVTKLSTSYAQFECIGTGSGLIYYAYYNDGSSVKWSGWSTKFLPLTGGTLTGDITVSKSGDHSRFTALNDKGKVAFIMRTDGSFGIWDYTINNFLMGRNSNGTLNMEGKTPLHTGNSAKVTIGSTQPTDGLWVVP